MSKCKTCNFRFKESEKPVVCSICKAELHEDCSIKANGTHFCDVCYASDFDHSDDFVSMYVLPDVIRRSHIESYRTCPYMFLKEAIELVQQSQSSFAQVGIDLHELFYEGSKGMYKDKEDMALTFLIKYFNNYNDDIFKKSLVLFKDKTLEQHKADMYQVALDSIETFFKILPTLPKEAYALEEKLILEVGEGLPKISITMDRIDMVDGELEVLDWKTGGVMVGVKLSSDLQAPLYIRAIQNHYKLPVRKFTFHYLADNKTRVFERINENEYKCTVGKRDYIIILSDAIKEVQRLFSRMKKGEFSIPTDSRSMYFACKVCGYKYDGVCSGADVQSWIQINGDKINENNGDEFVWKK